MIEEVEPIWRYIRSGYDPSLILVELTPDEAPFDGSILDRDGRSIEFVEVTAPPLLDDHEFRREAPAGLSMLSYLDHIYKLQSMDEYATAVLAVIKRKILTAYPEPTTLVVAVADEMVLEEPRRLQELGGRLAEAIPENRFRRIALVAAGCDAHLIAASEQQTPDERA